MHEKDPFYFVSASWNRNPASVAPVLIENFVEERAVGHFVAQERGNIRKLTKEGHMALLIHDPNLDDAQRLATVSQVTFRGATAPRRAVPPRAYQRQMEILQASTNDVLSMMELPPETGNLQSTNQELLFSPELPSPFPEVTKELSERYSRPITVYTEALQDQYGWTHRGSNSHVEGGGVFKRRADFSTPTHMYLKASVKDL